MASGLVCEHNKIATQVLLVAFLDNCHWSRGNNNGKFYLGKPCPKPCGYFWCQRATLPERHCSAGGPLWCHQSQSCSWKGRGQPPVPGLSSPWGGQSQCTQGTSAHRELFSPLWPTVGTDQQQRHTQSISPAMLNSEPVDTERTLSVGHQCWDTRPFTLRWQVTFPALAWVTSHYYLMATMCLVWDYDFYPSSCKSLLVIPTSCVQDCLKDIKSPFRSLSLHVFSNLCCVRSRKFSYSLNCFHLGIPFQIIF